MCYLRACGIFYNTILRYSYITLSCRSNLILLHATCVMHFRKYRKVFFNLEINNNILPSQTENAICIKLFLQAIIEFLLKAIILYKLNYLRQIITSAYYRVIISRKSISQTSVRIYFQFCFTAILPWININNSDRSLQTAILKRIYIQSILSN